MRGTLEERFWEKVAFLGAEPDECWEWRGAKSEQGYGYIRGSGHGSMLRAHRIAWELANGPISAGTCVLHRCDNPSCVNPAHLFLGTSTDNSHDMVNKGRSARGERNGESKLIEQDVHEIRQMLSQNILERVIAKKYGVSRKAISTIKTGENWNWLKEVTA